jgi:arginyl-tRNA synthetase
MNVFSDFHERIRHILQSMVEEGRLPDRLDLNRFVVEPPRETGHGDLACNAAMVFAKEARSHFANPRQMAVEIAAALVAESDVEQAEVAGAGFINISLRPSVWATVLRTVLASGANFARSTRPRTEAPINVEYVSTNPTGPLHVGHGRGAVFGDCLANLLTFAGYGVTREYYVNDAGAQVDILARSAYLRYRQALGEPVGAISERLYPGDYLRPVGAAIARQYGRSLIDVPEGQWLIPVRRAAIDAMMAMIRDDLALLAIRHDVFFSERSLLETGNGQNAVGEAIDLLRARGLIYEGRLPPPKGDIDEDWEDRPQTLFRSTNFGDDMDRPLVKSDGSYTYFASDIAYHLSKIRRGFRTLIDVWGADHGGYVKRVSAAVTALSDGQAALDVKICQLVKLLRHGAPVKMSKRAGDFVTLREVVEEVGRDPVRFMMMYRKNDATLEFDLARVIEQSKDNPVFYVQYAHARGRSVLRQAVAAWPGLDCRPAALAEARLELLTDPGERSLIKVIAQYPRLIELASSQHEPHRVAFYLHDLASLFHSHWNRGKDLPQLRFVNETDRDLTGARLALVCSLTTVLASGLAILGVSAPDEMR